MRLPKIARSAVATLSVTALITGGGLVSGAFVGTASATEVYTVKSPNNDNGGRQVFNAGVQSFRIYGKGFQPSFATSVSLHRSTAADGQDDIDAESVEDNSGRCGAGTAGITCGDTLDFTADLTNAAPGTYDVLITQGAGPTAEPDQCTGCVEVLASGSPTLTSVARYNATDGQLTFTGGFLPKGTRLEWLYADSSGVDPYITFDPNTEDSSGNVTPGYISPTTLRGTYTATSQATPGLHKVRARTTDGQISNTIDFYQPVIIGASPSALGQGATQVPVTINGNGFHPSTFFTVAQGSTAAADVITVLPPTANTPTSVTAPVTVQPTSAVKTRAVTVRGPDGGFATAADLIAITNGPKFATSNPVTPTTRGQGSDTSITTVSGSYFNLGTVFDFGAGVTSQIVNITGANTATSAATLRLVVAPDAPLSARSVIATNTDFGRAVLANGWTVTPSPKVTSLDPPSASPGTGPFNVLLNGSDFTANQNFAIALVPATGITVGTVNRVSNSQLQTTFSVAAGTNAGARDVVVTNTSTGGSSTCTGCFGINSLSVTPNSSSNTVVKTLTLTSNLAGSPLSADTTVRIFLPGPPAYQGDVPVSNVAYNAMTGRITLDADLRNAATGLYSVEATTTGTPVLSCTGCLTVKAPAPPTVSSVTPATGGQGATNRSITITGSNFSPGERVTFSGTGVTANNVVFVDANTIRALVTVDPTAMPGLRTVTVTNIGDRQAGASSGQVGFTVTAAPVTTAIDPTQVGQGATVDVTVTGTGYSNDAQAVFSGTGVTAQLKDGSGAPTSLVYSVTVAPGADVDTASPRSLTITNADGGTSTLANALKVTAAPKITKFAPATGKAGTTLTDVTITGTGFASTTTGEGETAVTKFPEFTIADVTVTVKSLSEDGTTIVADLVIKGTAASGARPVLVVNPDKGKSTAPGAFTVATNPSAPQNVVATPGDKQAVITWNAPADAGGSDLVNYTVDDGDSTTANSVTVPAGQPRTATLTGLTNGKAYTFTVVATNGVGTGAAGTATGTPFGKPLAPTGVVATVSSNTVTITWNAADAQGKPIVSYKVEGSAANGTLTPQTKTVDQPRSATFTNLVAGTAYSFTVLATNSAGDSPKSAPVSATPKYGAKLTSTRNLASPVAGQGTVLSGRLTRSDGLAIANATIALKLTPTIGASRSVNVLTNSNGDWRYGYVPTYNTAVRASYAGTSDVSAVNATSYTLPVRTRITVTSPRSGATTPASTTLQVKGTTSPNKAGRVVFLKRGTTVLARATVASNGTFVFNTKLARGAYTLYVNIGATSGNVAANSSNFIVRRS